MRVPATGADTIGLIKPRLCNTNDAIPSETFDGLKLRCDDAFPNKTLDEVRTQQWLDQVRDSKITCSGHKLTLSAGGQHKCHSIAWGQ